MYLSQRVLIKHNGVVIEGKVVKIHSEKLDIELDNGELVQRKYWEIRSVSYEKK